jgi:Tol biopolymer transport system component/DNA-binding winged helix-turn-helix (wHTH) protein
MLDQSERPQVFRFGVFEVDPRAGELRKNGIKLKLQEQPLQVLCMLVEHAGEVVTRRDLRTRLWPAETFVDFDHGLNAAVKRLRDTLGDSAETPVYIETLPRRGYRFLLPVQGTSSTAAEAATPPGAFARPPRLVILSTGLALAVGILVAMLIYAGRYSANSSAAPMKVLPFTVESGAEFAPSFSPDGRQVAYATWDGAGNFTANVYVKLVGGNDPLRLTKDPGWACCIAWSPDGEYVAYERCDGPRRGLYVVPALGGPERRLTDASCMGISWSPDGSHIALVYSDPTNSAGAIFFLDTRNLSLHRVTSPPGIDIGDRLPIFSPDGKLLAFVRASSPWVTDLYVLPLAGIEVRQLTFDNTEIRSLAWTAEGRHLVIASHRAGGMSLWTVAITGGAPEIVPVGGAETWELDISHQGKRLAYRTGRMRPNIWQMDLDSSHKGTAPKPLLSSTTGEGGPQFSPDGTKLAFASNRSGSSEIWTCDADGSALVQMTSLGTLSGAPRWSPDGSHIAFDARTEKHGHIFVVSASGGAPRPVTSGGFEDAVPSWSSDGKWLYFASNRTGSWQLWKSSSEGGEPVQVTKHTGYMGFESKDGREVYYVKLGEPGVWRQRVSGGPEAQILKTKINSGQWVLTRQGIYFVDQTGSSPVIKFLNFARAKVTDVATLSKPLPPEEPGLDVSPDGRRIVFQQVVSDAQIMLVENFR